MVLVRGTHRERSRQSDGLGGRSERQAVPLIDLDRVVDALLDVIREQESGNVRGDAVQAALHSRGECRRACRAPVRGRVFHRLEDGLTFGCTLCGQHVKGCGRREVRSHLQCHSLRGQAALRRDFRSSHYSLVVGILLQLLHLGRQYTVSRFYPQFGSRFRLTSDRGEQNDTS